MKKRHKEGGKAAKKELKRAVNEAADEIDYRLERDKAVLPDKDWQEISNELDNLFTTFQNHQDFRDAVPRLFALADYISNSSSVKVSGSDAEAVGMEAKQLVAQFSGTEELDDLLDSIYRLQKNVRTNEKALRWWAKFRRHTEHVTTNYKGKEDLEEFRRMFRKGYVIFKGHKDEIVDVIDRLSRVLDNISNDKYILRLQESLSTLSDDLVWQDSDGKRYLDQESVNHLSNSITGVLREQFKYLALPRIHRTDKGTDYVLDNLVIKATLPDKIKFHQEAFAVLDTTNTVGSSVDSEIFLTASMKGITLEAPEIHFQYNGKITESGIMSVRIAPPGARLSIDFVMKPISKATDPKPLGEGHFSTLSTLGGLGGMGATAGKKLRYQFVRIKTHFTISNMDISYDKSTLSHKFLVPLATSLFKASIIDRIESGIEAALDKGLVNLGEQVIAKLNQLPNPLSLSSLGFGGSS